MVSRWAIKFLPLPEKVFRKYKRAVGARWRRDEAYIKVNASVDAPASCGGQGRGATVDFLLRARLELRGTIAVVPTAKATGHPVTGVELGDY